MERKRLAARLAHSGDDGFSLIELVIVLVTLPIVVGAIATVVITVLNNTTAATQSIFDSADSQITSATFMGDVQSASLVTTSGKSSPLPCTPGPAHQYPTPKLLLALQVPATSGAGSSVVVSYWYVPTQVKVLNSASTPENELVRDVCANGPNPAVTKVLAHDISSQASPPTATIMPLAQANAAKNNWISASAVAGISLAALEPASGINYQILAVPRAWSSGTGARAREETSTVSFPSAAPGRRSLVWSTAGPSR